MDKADEEFVEYFKTPKRKFIFYTFSPPIMLFVFVVASITAPFEALNNRFRGRKLE